jgi:hypothetical protein
MTITQSSRSNHKRFKQSSEYSRSELAVIQAVRAKIAFERNKLLGYPIKPYNEFVNEGHLTASQRSTVKDYVRQCMKKWVDAAVEARCTVETIRDDDGASDVEGTKILVDHDDEGGDGDEFCSGEEDGNGDANPEEGGKDDDATPPQKGVIADGNEFKCSFEQCGPPPSGSVPFDNECHFRSFIGDDKRDLMIAILTSFYFEDKGLTSTQLSLALHGKTYKERASVEVVKQDFFDRFSHKHFQYSSDISCTYGFLLYPTEHLHVLNQSRWKETVIKKQAMDLKFKELQAINKNFSPTNMMDCLKGNSQVSGEKNVNHFFKTAWDLQADGDQTNATLTEGSIKHLVTQLHKKDCLSIKDVILDIGSSYNSLMWNVSETIHNLIPGSDPVCIGYEYSVFRHLVGSSRAYAMLKDAGVRDHSPIRSCNVHAFLVNMFELNSLGDGITIAFQFDKAFVIELCIHTLLCALASKDLKYFISCKATTENTQGKYKFQDFVQITGCFELITIIKGCKMNGGESATPFHVYKRNNKKVLVNLQFIEQFAKDVCLDEVTTEIVMETWKLASGPPDLSQCINNKKTLGEQKICYYNQWQKASALLDERRRRSELWDMQ